MQHLHIIYASTSGHTEYVIDVLQQYVNEHAAGIEVTRQRVEEAQPDDLLRGDVLLLASGTWNTGGIEGQLNPHMYTYLLKDAKSIDLAERPVAVIGLGDQRYRYLAFAAVQLERFIKKHNGVHLGTTLRVINEPYGQEDSVHAWAEKLLQLISTLNV